MGVWTSVVAGVLAEHQAPGVTFSSQSRAARSTTTRSVVPPSLSLLRNETLLQDCGYRSMSSTFAAATAFAAVAFQRRLSARRSPSHQQPAICRQAAKPAAKSKPGPGKGPKPAQGAKGPPAKPARKAPQVAVKEEDDLIIVPADGCTIAELSQLIKKPPASIITYFFAEKRMPLTINDFLERQICADVAQKFGVEILFDDEKVTTAGDRGFLSQEHIGDNAELRPPVVTVMGHVDHGKTTLLDTIRQRSVAATEAGGITQRIGAYTVEVKGQRVTFIDTPGHEAFTAMRARGAQVTDIAVLVVAADDGVMPQTREAIAHARAANVPIIVAINKIDIPGADPQKSRQALAEEGLLAEDWGGDITMVEVSAKKNINIDELLELITLTAEVQDLKALKTGPAAGVILESVFEPARGSLATLLVQRGTLKIGDYAVAGTNLARVRSMQNEAGIEMKEAGPSTAVQILGFADPPQAGDQFEVFTSLQEAKDTIEEREKKIVKQGPLGFVGLGSSGSDEAMKLAVILKTDAQGSIAAVKQMFSDIKDSRYVNLRWVLAAPGPITDSDVELASTCPKDQRVMILGFNTPVGPSAASKAKLLDVKIQTYKVIYELFDAVVAALQSELGEEEQLIEKGLAEVKAVFDGKDGKIAGCKVLEGRLTKGFRVKAYRKGKLVGEGPIRTIRVFKEEVPDVDEGKECGFNVQGFEDWQAGDEVRCFEVKVVQRKLISDKKK